MIVDFGELKIRLIIWDKLKDNEALFISSDCKTGVKVVFDEDKKDEKIDENKD